MNKHARTSLLITTVCAGVFLFVGRAIAAESINVYDTSITINRDASINVTEVIAYDFGAAQRHGIFRNIPVRYSEGFSTRHTDLSGILVTDERGSPRPFEVSRSGGDLELKIGDPVVYVSGEQVYVISYHVENVVNFYDTFDELYWNVIGDGWDVPIRQSSATVTLPEQIPDSSVQYACYAGPTGSTAPCEDSSLSDNTLLFSHNNLGYGNNLTIAVGLPKGVIQEPPLAQQLWQLIKSYWGAIVFLAVLIYLPYRWWTRGRDPKGRTTIITQFDPPDALTPIESGALFDEKIHSFDLSAEIIFLAIHGYIRINRIEKKWIFGKTDYRLDLLKSPDDLESRVDTQLLNDLFSHGDSGKGDVLKTVELSKLTNKFYKDLKALKQDVWKDMVRQKYFKSSPPTVRNIYFIISAILVFLPLYLGFVFGFANSAFIMAAGLLFFIFSFIMPVKTKKGVLAREHLLGLKRYISVAEKDRIDFHNAPEKKPELFEKLLPYAMILGVEKKWAREFEDIYTQPPEWYNDSHMTAFNAVIFTNSLNSFHATANKSLASSPSSSGSGGGGFSGGGFGGGGGGSW